jgi:hypothetical protein
VQLQQTCAIELLHTQDSLPAFGCAPNDCRRQTAGETQLLLAALTDDELVDWQRVLKVVPEGRRVCQ